MRLALLLTTLLAGTANAERPFDLSRTPGELPRTVIPSAYTVAIVTDMARLRFTGHVGIKIDATAPVDRIVLNQAGLALSHATVDGRPAPVTQDEAAQTATLHVPIAKGPHSIAIDYAGPIPQSPNGIYHDDYTDPAGARQRMLVTQFEVADARRMLPCWDEPAFKATFQLTATLPTAYVPVGNMPVLATHPAMPGSTQVVFATTPRMSTYLLALFAGRLSALHAPATPGATPISLYAATGAQQGGSYALDAATKILPYYNTYFGVPYPLPKLDLIAVPGNYDAGAMENWGAISFIDNDLLFTPATSAPSTQESVFLTVAHEMAHQWSGDLVTMGWWDDIWLNEGFATWMENKATDHFNPDWQIWPRQHSDREIAMDIDARPSTHAIQQVIRNSSEADSAFDRISYQKGGQVIRMLEDWLGADVFRDGMRRYMQAHQYGNATSADLWAALQDVSHRDVAAIATGFTEQPGIPLVSVARQCDGGQARITLMQGRFTVHDPNPAALHWQIPVSAGGPGMAAQKIVLGAQPAALTIGGCDAALKVNLGENGYYRTRYDAASLAALQAGFQRLAPADRVNLLGDQYALFTADLAPLSDYLTLVDRLAADRSYAVVADTIDHLVALDTMLRGDPARAAFRAYARGILQPHLAMLGWDVRPGETFLDTLLRPALIGALGRFDDPQIAAGARQRFADLAALPPSLLGPVLLQVGRTADAATFARLQAMVVAAPDTEGKLRVFAAMAAARDPALQDRAVRFAAGGGIPNGRIVRSLAQVAATSDDPGRIWRLVTALQPTIRPRLTPGGLDDLLPSLLATSTDQNLAAALLVQPASTATPAGRIRAARAVDGVAANAALAARARPAIAAWLHASH